MWTRFMDMHSGGGAKTDFEYIYIEAPEEQAKEVFRRRFNRDPDNTTCNCCGGDYSLSEYDTLNNATGFDRNARLTHSDKLYGGNNDLYVDPRKPIPEGYVVKCGYGLYGHTPKYETLKSYLKRKEVLVIRKREFKAMKGTA